MEFEPVQGGQRITCAVTQLFGIIKWTYATYLITYFLIYLLTPWLYGPLTALAPLITDANSSLSAAFCRHQLTFICHRSFSTSSSHHNLGLPLLLLPSGLLSDIFLTVLPWSVLITYPIHSSLFFLISAAMSRSVYSALNSPLVLILHFPCSTTGPYILLNIFLSHIHCFFIPNSVTAHVALPNTATGFTTILYILILTALRMTLDLNICLR